MRKLVVFLLFCFFATVFPQSLHASFITVNHDGGVTWNVLAESTGVGLEIPQRSDLEVTQIADTIPTPEAKVKLTKDEEGKINLQVTGPQMDKKLDVTTWKDDLIDIEERPQVQNLKVKIVDSGFSLIQKGIAATTSYPINIDAKTAELSLSTESGDRLLSILPLQAVEGVLRAKILSNVRNNQIAIVEENQNLLYVVDGEKNLNLFNVYSYPVSITAKVSASTGEILTVDSPKWYKLVGFLFI